MDKFYFGKWKWKWLLASIACRGRSKEVVGRDVQFSRAFRYKIIARLGSKCWIIKASTLNRTSWHVWLGELTVSTRSVGDMIACLLANLPYPPERSYLIWLALISHVTFIRSLVVTACWLSSFRSTNYAFYPDMSNVEDLSRTYSRYRSSINANFSLKPVNLSTENFYKSNLNYFSRKGRDRV